MDHQHMQDRLGTLLADEAPAFVVDECRRLFDLRAVSDEVADVAELADVGVSDAALRERVTTAVFAGDTQLIGVCVDRSNARGVGRVEPARVTSVRLVGLEGTREVATTDERGAFELTHLRGGRVQLIVEPGDGWRSLRTTWTTLWRPYDGSTARPAAVPQDEINRLRMSRHLNNALGRYLRGTSDTGAATMRLVGALEPATAQVTRRLAAAAQRGGRALPSQSWTASDSRLVVTLEETRGARLALSVSALPDVTHGLVVRVWWTTTTADGSTVSDRLVTPVPSEPKRPRRATYEVGSSADLKAFGIGSVQLVEADDVTPDMLASALGLHPYGNAVRAWSEFVEQLDDARLRVALDQAVRRH